MSELRLTPPALALLLALFSTGQLTACASQPAAVRMPPRVPGTVCLGCGTISAREPGELPRWIFHVQMDDGTEAVVFQERADWLVVGARVRLAGGSLQKP